MRATVPSRCAGADGNCGRLVRREARPARAASGSRWFADGRLVDSRALSTREEAVDFVHAAATAGRRRLRLLVRGPGVVRARARLRDDRRRVGARRARRRALAARRRRRSGATRCDVPRRATVPRGASDCAYPARAEVDLPARRQRPGRRRIGARHAATSPDSATRGFAIWPFDDAGDRTALEIYPSLLRKQFPALDETDAPSPHARDARASARVMQTRTDELSLLAATHDPVTRLEGDVWVPTMFTRPQPATRPGVG